MNPSVIPRGQCESHRASAPATEDAYRLLESPAAKAFDLALEPQHPNDFNTSTFGLGCPARAAYFSKRSARSSKARLKRPVPAMGQRTTTA